MAGQLASGGQAQGPRLARAAQHHRQRQLVRIRHRQSAQDIFTHSLTAADGYKYIIFRLCLPLALRQRPHQCCESGSGIRSGIRIWDGKKIWIRDEHPKSFFGELRTIF